jgi:hypothetical protein
MQVEATGLFFDGKCSVQTEVCRARDFGALTAVTTAEGKRIVVCGACLDKMADTGAWHIPGTRPQPRPLARAETHEPTPVAGPPA